jgi:ATP-binding cassette subfamily A (ABC1) protein 2
MKELLRKLKLLIWKNILLKKRQPVVIAIEIFCPLALAAILSLFRLDPNNQPERESAVTFAPRALPSAGLVPFLQGIVCDPNVQLGSKRGYWMENDENGFVNLNPNISKIIGNLTEMLNDPDIGWAKLMEMPDNMQSVVDDWKELLLAWSKRNTSFMDGGQFPLTKVIQNDTQLRDFLQKQLNFSQSVTDSFMSASLNTTHLQQTSSDKAASLYNCLVNASDCHLENTLQANPSFYQPTIQGIFQAIRQSDSYGLQQEIQNLFAVAGVGNGLVSCDEAGVGDVFVFSSERDKRNVNDAVCGLSIAKRQDLARLLASQINISKAIKADSTLYPLSLYKRLLTDTQNLTSNYESVSRLQSYVTALYQADPDLWELQPVRSAYRGPVKGDPIDIVDRVGSGRGVTKHPEKIEHDVKCRLLCGHFTSYCKTSSSKSSSAPLRYASGYEAKGARNEDSVSSRIRKGIKILYAPHTPSVNKVITKANRTMEQIACLGLMASKVANYTASLDPLVENLTLISNSTKFIFNQMCNLKSPANSQMQNSIQSSSSQAQNGTNNTRVDAHVDPRVNTRVDEYCDYWRQVYPKLSNGELQSLVAQINSLVRGVSDELNGLKLDVWVGFPDEKSLDVFAAQAPVNDSTIWAGVVFTNVSENGSLPHHVQYKIKMNKTLVFDPGQLRDRDWSPGPRDKDFNLLYEVFGFVYIQDLIDRAIINVIANTTVREPGGYLQQFPYPCYNFDRLARNLYQYGLLSVALVFSWVFSVAMIIRNVVFEKEQRLKEVKVCWNWLMLQGTNRVGILDDENHGSEWIFVVDHVVYDQFSVCCYFFDYLVYDTKVWPDFHPQQLPSNITLFPQL